MARTDVEAVWVGLDLGTSAAKGIALGGDGIVVGRAMAEYPTERPGPHASEQDPAQWLRACTEVVAQLRDEVHPGAWRGIALSGMIPTLVVLDERLTPLAPAVTWEDARAELQGERLRAAAGADWLYERTGQWLDGRYLLPMYARLATAEPAVAARARYLAGAKDLLFAWLTGELLTDPSTASGYGAYDARTGEWLAEPVDALEAELGTPVPRLPAVEPSVSTRPLSATSALTLGLPAGLPVCLGAADSVLGALGLGAVAPGDLAYIAGTSNVVLAVAEDWTPDAHHRYLLTPLAHPADAYGLEMDLLATGSAFRWLSQLLGGGEDEASLIALAGEVQPDAAPAFLPYLAPGEQGALWSPDLHGTVAGLHLAHGGVDLARGLLNGIVLESRRCLEVLSDAGLPAGEIRVAGWCATDPGVLRDLSDCCRREVRAASQDARDCTAIGAARLLALSLGDQLLEVDLAASEVFRTDEGRARDWDALWERHERLREAATSIYERREVACTES
ncbi:MAG: xylulokinase [Solirubrobacteraceae bacterium]